MGVSVSSANAYRNHVMPEVESTQVEKITTYLRGQGWRSRREISKATGIEPGAVGGRVNKLVGAKVLQEAGFLMECPVTGRRVKMVRLALGDQQDFFQ